MFKLGLKSYFKNLPHFFTILGVIALFLILGICIVTPIVITCTNNCVNSISATFNDIQSEVTSFNPEQSLNKFINILKNLNWNKPSEALNKVLDVNWLLDTLKSCVPVEVCEVWSNYAPTLSNSLTTYVVSLTAQTLSLIIILIVGTIASIIITKLLIDLKSKPRNPIRYIISFVLDIILFIGIWCLFFYLLSLNKFVPYILLFIVFVLMIVLYPIQNVLVYGRGKVEIKDVLTFSNFIKLGLSTLIGFGISFIIVFLSYQYFSQPFAIIISLPLFMLTYLVCENTSKNYVCSLYNQLIEDEMKKNSED